MKRKKKKGEMQEEAEAQKEVTEERQKKAQTEVKAQGEAQKEAQAEVREEAQQEDQGTGEKVRLIENPLPLPRKHVKKAMDYKIDVSEEQMKYDREVPENDDFDLQ